MSKRISITLTDQEYEELKALAVLKKRTVNLQAAYLLNNALPNLSLMRRAGDQPQQAPAVDPQSHPVVDPDATHPVPPVEGPSGQ